MSAAGERDLAGAGPGPGSDAGAAPHHPLTAALSGRAGNWLAAAVGAPMLLGFAPFHLFWLPPVLLSVLFALLQDVSPRRAALRGFSFGFTACLCGMYWLYISLHEFGEAPLWIAIPLMLALVAWLGAYLAAMGWIANRFFPTAGLVRWLLVLPALWTMLEHTRGWLLSGFPWLAVGYSQLDGPFAGLAPLGGVFSMSLAGVFTAGAMCALLLGRGRARVPGVVGVLVLALIAAAGQRGDWTAPVRSPLSVSIVQGGISQDQKWLPEQREATKTLYRELTEPHYGRDLLIWPEAAIPALLAEEQQYLQGVFDASQAAGSAFVLGMVHYDFRDQQFFNSVLSYDGGELQFYYKHHLVPFGEYFPVPQFVREWMRLMSLPYNDFTAGPANQPPLRVAGEALGISICYEDVFGEELIGALPEASILVNVSNDGWFGGSVAPHQHLQIARVRAAETGRELIRATNGGISATIDWRGNVLETLPQFEPAVLNVEVQPREGATPYVRYGNVPVMIVGALMLVLASGTRRFGGAGRAPRG